ncbi:MAG: hypothetical protein QXH26_00280 [Candidatus Hadarchaeales archaeon]
MHSEIVWRAFSSVLPYLVYPQELKQLLEESPGAPVEVLVQRLREAIPKLDEIRRTDIRIFLNELERLVRAGGA